MVDIFITDSRKKYDRSTHPDKILYLDGFIVECSFISQAEIGEFNNSLVGLDSEAGRLMLEKFDEDVQTIITKDLKFGANRFISGLPATEKIHSTLLNFHRSFVLKKYLFRIVFDRFFTRFSISPGPLILSLSESYCLTRDLAYDIKSADYYNEFGNVYFDYLIRQPYYFLRHLFRLKKKIPKAHIAVFLLDIPNEYDLIRKFVELVKKQDHLTMSIVLIDSGNPAGKRVDPSLYQGGNVHVSYIHEYKENLFTGYSGFYSVCEKINPLYKVFKKARLCEAEDIQYAFMDNAISAISPKVCLYLNTQEYGRVMANVCAAYNIPSICVDYSFFFDTYNIEKRIRFDVRACISDGSAQNWIKHKDPTPRHEIIGFCKIDDWQEKYKIREQSKNNRIFDNGKRTILFASTWAPNPHSPLLTEKVRIIKELSEICSRNDWNLIVKKHPSEFDNMIDNVFNNNKYANQRIFEHNEMSLFDCVYSSDFVCTQNSSAFIEALFLNKPFSYISTHGQNNWAAMSYFSKEKEVVTFSSVIDYERYLLEHTGDAAYQKLLLDFRRLQSKYLYKTDGKASERLLDLARSFI
jgi:hypothetical protein